MDRDWWKTYLADVDANFKGERFSNNSHSGNYRTTKIDQSCFGNSGAGAIVVAAIGGASKIILLGYDCQHTGGKAHWHNDHPKHLGNARKINHWGEKFAELGKRYSHIQIVNASRETALTCFTRQTLDEAL
jgi:hypothetical protein